MTFTRPDLARVEKEGGVFSEVDVKWINPREFHRKAISDLERLGYGVPRGKDESLALQKEVIGSKTGSVESRIQGIKSDNVSKGVISFRPYTSAGTVIGIIGALLLFYSLATQQGLSLFGGSILLLGIGVFIVRYQKTATFVIYLVSVIRILSLGEATERSLKKEGSEVTDLFAQLTVSCSGNLEIHVPLDLIGSSAMKAALLKAVPNAAYRFPASKSLLKPYLVGNIETEFGRELSTISETVMKISKQVESYGYGV